MNPASLNRPKEPTEWTLMFYFASDNPLAPSIVNQLKAIKDAGFHPEANVVARFDPNTAQTPTHIFEVNLINKLKAKQGDRVGFGNDPFVRSLIEDKLWGDHDVDAQGRSIREKIASYLATKKIEYNPPRLEEKDDPNVRKVAKEPGRDFPLEPDPYTSLNDFLEFCSANYPARHYMLFILGHGIIVGNDIFLADEHVDKGGNSLTLKKLGEILNYFKGLIQDKDPHSALELISFHSCSLSGLEVAYELKDSAKYMLASQGPAFVASWPYLHILMRVFNDLNSSGFRTYDFKNAAALATKLKSENSPVSDYLRDGLSSRGTGTELLDKIIEQPDDPELLQALAEGLNTLLDDPNMYQQERFPSLSKPAQHLVDRRQDRRRLRRLNRRLILENYPDELERINIKRLVCRIFYYVLYNSYDFQMAGYSFDLCLTDLSKLSDVETPSVDAKTPSIKVALNALAKALIQGLPKTNRPEDATLEGKLILLSHWEAQSYWQENYTDLYDFCLVLQQSCRTVGDDAAPGIKDIREACEKLMGLLRRGFEQDDNRIIIRSECAGPTYQYSHGLSIFFPWTKPVGSKMWDGDEENDRYGNYALIDFAKADESNPCWKSFLDRYFEVTVRRTRGDLDDLFDRRAAKQQTDNDISDADLLEEITGILYNASGQLKAGPKDTTGKGGSKDPTGDDDCGCPSIKNYPRRTQATSGLIRGLQELLDHEIGV